MEVRHNLRKLVTFSSMAKTTQSKKSQDSLDPSRSDIILKLFQKIISHRGHRSNTKNRVLASNKVVITASVPKIPISAGNRTKICNLQ